jgi:pimeloyl-ACP methyl ester carboxylesterase
MKLRPLAGILFILVALLSSCNLLAQREISFPLPGQTVQIHGDIYGHGPRAVILAHGGRFGKESWKPQAQVLANAGFLVLALRFRGDRTNPDGTTGDFGSYPDNAEDVLAAVAYLRSIGTKSISAIGGSLGGDAVGNADAQSPPGTFDRIVILAAEGGDAPEKLTGRKLFIFARDDTSGDGPRLPGITRNYEKASQPKKLVILDGSAHAQFLFGTPPAAHIQIRVPHPRCV